MERVFGLKPFKHRRTHINPKMVEGNVPLLRSKADEGQRLSGCGLVPFGVGGERNGECDHPVADSLLKARRQVFPEAVQECQHNFSTLLLKRGDLLF